MEKATFAVTTFINIAISVFCAGQVLFGWIGNGFVGKGIMSGKQSSAVQSYSSGPSYIYSILRPDTYYYDEGAENKASLQNNSRSETSLNDAVNEEMSKQKDEIDALKAELESLKAQMPTR